MSAPSHLYVHVPFCARRCSYCDFAIAVRRRVPVDEYLAALARELALRARAWPWMLDTLYFGGGTPSRLGGEGVARTVASVRERVRLEEGAEVTLEANPDDLTPDTIRAWRGAGVNRLSVGGQSFDESVLRWMHRTHDAGQITRAMQVARDEGIENISLDLIFAVPAELERDWRGDLERAVALEPDHISLYGLTVEEGTPLGRWRARGAVREAAEEDYERDFLLAHDLLLSAGYEHYEVSNYARPGRLSRHNSAYWTGEAYEGIGPSAHAYDVTERRWNVAPYEAWRRIAMAGGDPTAGRETLTWEQREAERVYLGLRTTSGLAAEPSWEDRIGRWVRAGWAEVSDGILRLTPAGWLRLDALASDLTVVATA